MSKLPTFMNKVYVALDNIRSLENVGAIMRTCSFFGVPNLVLIGYSGTDINFKGERVLHSTITKTALGAEKDLNIKIFESYGEFFDFVRNENLEIVSIEQNAKAIKLGDFTFKNELDAGLVLVFGNEREGVSTEILDKSSKVVEIERLGSKNSLNVATCVGIVLHHIALIL